MADNVHVDAAQLREAARQHSAAAEQLRTVPQCHGAIQDSLDSLGPIFGELAEAGRQLLEERRLCYEQQADDHAAIADTLLKSASYWEEHEANNVQQLRAVLDEPR